MDNLDAFLKGDEPTDPQAADPAIVDPVADPQPVSGDPAEPVAADPAAADRPRGPDGKFISKGDTQPVDPAQAASPAAEEPKLDHAALIGERRRRQALETELEQLKAQLAQPQQQPIAQAPAPPPEPWDEGYDQWLIKEAAKAAREEATNAVQQHRIYTSAVAARSRHEDYDAAHAVFGDMVQANPSLFHQMLGAADPAEFAYQAAKTEMEIRQYGGIDKLVEARVAARLAQPAPQPIPDTLADAQSARGSTATGGFHVLTLDEILKR
jgi:hypothetical protein